jgi:hypothetical protein
VTARTQWRCATLRRLVLAGNALGPVGVGSLLARLTPDAAGRYNTTLEELDISEVSLCHGYFAAEASCGAGAIAAMLRSNTSLRRLSLRQNALGATQLAALLKSHRGSGLLPELDLSTNPLMADGAAVLANALTEAEDAGKPPVRTLDPLEVGEGGDGGKGGGGGNGGDSCDAAVVDLVGYSGGSHIPRPIDRDCVGRRGGSVRDLQMLNLAGCRIDSAAAISIASALSGLPLLRMLDLSHNHLGAVGAVAIASSIREGACGDSTMCVRRVLCVRCAHCVYGMLCMCCVVYCVYSVYSVYIVYGVLCVVCVLCCVMCVVCCV